MSPRLAIWVGILSLSCAAPAEREPLRQERAWIQGVESQVLTPRNSMPQDWFGISVALRGDRILVGTLRDTVYEFLRTGGAWVEAVKYTTPVTDASLPRFGEKVALSDMAGFTSAPNEPNPELLGGVVFVLPQQSRLAPRMPNAGDQFGDGLAARGSRLVVGAPHILESGSAFVFELSAGTWTERAKLVSNVPTDQHSFGAEAAM